jgi:hypothetical protein
MSQQDEIMSDDHEDSPVPNPDAPPEGQGERRAASRVEVDLFVREYDGERLFVHPALNLSATGIFLESASYSLRSALERQFVDLELEVPGHDEPIRVQGRVVGARRVRGFSHGLAVQFTNLSPEARAAIADYVETRLASGAGEGPSSEAAPTED